MEHRFDTLAKAMAGSISRREAIIRLGGGLAGAVLASLGLGRAWSDSAPNSQCEDFCRSTCGISPGGGNAFGKCVSSCEHCVHDTGGQLPCGCPASTGGDVVCTNCCAPAGRFCESDGQCCSGLTCSTCGPPHCCKPNGQQCAGGNECCSGACGGGVCVCVPSGRNVDVDCCSQCCSGSCLSTDPGVCA